MLCADTFYEFDFSELINYSEGKFDSVYFDLCHPKALEVKYDFKKKDSEMKAFRYVINNNNIFYKDTTVSLEKIKECNYYLKKANSKRISFILDARSSPWLPHLLKDIKTDDLSIYYFVGHEFDPIIFRTALRCSKKLTFTFSSLLADLKILIPVFKIYIEEFTLQNKEKSILDFHFDDFKVRFKFSFENGNFKLSNKIDIFPFFMEKELEKFNSVDYNIIGNNRIILFKQLFVIQNIKIIDISEDCDISYN